MAKVRDVDGAAAADMVSREEAWTAGAELGMTVMPLGDELAQLAMQMSPMLLAADSVAAAIQVLTSLTEKTIPGAIAAGVFLLDEQGQRTSSAATSQVVREQTTCNTSWTRGRV